MRIEIGPDLGHALRCFVSSKRCVLQKYHSNEKCKRAFHFSVAHFLVVTFLVRTQSESLI
jgi:hypothetical protein